MLTIEDLAARWKVGVAEAQEICRDQGVPFVPLKGGKDRMRIAWGKVRFRLQAIEAWEAGRQVAHRSYEQRQKDQQPRDLPGQRRLGSWE